jgi:hypothetical protein
MNREVLELLFTIHCAGKEEGFGVKKRQAAVPEQCSCGAVFSGPSPQSSVVRVSRRSRLRSRTYCCRLSGFGESGGREAASCCPKACVTAPATARALSVIKRLYSIMGLIVSCNTARPGACAYSLHFWIVNFPKKSSTTVFRSLEGILYE